MTRGWRGVFWLLSAALATMLLYRSHSLPLRDFRETRFAEIAREMLTRGDWVVPHLNGTPYFNKPPLVPWLVALSFSLFGIGEGPARLVSALAVLWTALLVGWLTARLFGHGKGPLGAALFLGTPAAQYYGRMLMTDTVVMACITTAVVAFLEGARRRQPWGYRVGWLACGLGVLAKGVIGVVYPLAALGLFLWRSERGAWRAVPWRSGVLLFSLVTLPWFLLLEARSPGFLYHSFVHQQAVRALSAEPYAFVALPRWQIVLSFLGLLGPAAFVLPWTVPALRQPGHPSRLLWFLALVVVGSVLLAAGRNHPYTLPALPPLVVVAAGWLSAPPEAVPAWQRRLSACGLALLGAALLFCLPWLGRLLPRLSPWLDDAPTHHVMAACLAVIAVLLLASSGLLWQRRAVAAAAVVAALMLPGAVMLVQVQQRLAPVESRASLARVLAREVPPAWPVVVADPRDRQFEGTGGWGFYARRTVHMVAFAPPRAGALQGGRRPAWLIEVAEVAAWQAAGRPFALLATDEALRHLPLGPLPPPRAQDGKFGLWLLAAPQRQP
ncbi:MAG: hypothetical protein KatS3mg131_3618 [Candidatus Tectimicrobiota bacterium]|nr:MAG: hypothetical protein KatS3mg131_3618 [Candidatus Tectomicrobia bacterium]